MLSKPQIINAFAPLCCEDGIGLEGFITEKTNDTIFERIAKIEEDHITYVQFNQLLSFANISAVSDAFYKYYWINANVKHTYDVRKLREYPHISFIGNNLSSLGQMKWGIERLMIDSLLYFGNINVGFAYLRDKSTKELNLFFQTKRYDTDLIANRGEPLKFIHIDKSDRYLISEMACKTYEKEPKALTDFLMASYREARKQGVYQPKIRHLLEGKYVDTQMNYAQLELSVTDICEETISDESVIMSKCEEIASRFDKARKAAVQNTRLFLSLVHDLDVYMATSMRNKDDFMQMANTCESIFSDSRIKPLNLRYFDPTISAAEGHEDKGLIECLMVKCCKALVYSAGERESYGKDAEAAMALSLGKPVIFLCESTQKQEFYKKIHPLGRLIDFNTGVANGVMVANSAYQVSELLRRLFTNDMQYEIKQKHKGYYILIENLTESIVRLQTNDKFLSNSFWNYYMHA